MYIYGVLTAVMLATLFAFLYELCLISKHSSMEKQLAASEAQQTKDLQAIKQKIKNQ